MQKAAIVIDVWKLPVFERHLAAAGYEFEQRPGLTGKTLTLTLTVTGSGRTRTARRSTPPRSLPGR